MRGGGLWLGENGGQVGSMVYGGGPYLCFMARAPVCVCVGGGGAIVTRQQGTPSQMVRFISPNPNPVTIPP